MVLSIKHHSMPIVISSPSAVGKSSLASALLKIDNNLKLSISTTTRQARVSEIEGVNYYFKTLDEFNKLIRQNTLLEYTYIYGNYYGTLKETVNKHLKQNNDVLFDIDYQGMGSIKKMLKQVITIFILPPNFSILKQRIQNRGQDNKEAIEIRMKLATEEIKSAKYYDYIVINDNFETTLKTIHSIIMAERTKRPRLDLKSFLTYLKNS